MKELRLPHTHAVGANDYKLILCNIMQAVHVLHHIHKNQISSLYNLATHFPHTVIPRSS